MYYAYLKDWNHDHHQELKASCPQGIPIFGDCPDDFLEIYDEYGELLDIQPAFRVNLAGLTPEAELRLFSHYASGTDDPRFVEGCFKLLDKGWVTIPEYEVELVVWRAREEVVCIESDEKSDGANRVVSESVEGIEQPPSPQQQADSPEDARFLFTRYPL